MVPHASPQIGDEFGDYRIVAELGRGGMGIVFRAWQRRVNQAVALKILPPGLATDPAYRARFGREVAALARLNSPHVVQIFDHGEVQGNLYLTMQLIEGSDLSSVVEKGPLPPRRALQITAQIAAALADAHSTGVVHRNIKPKNILVRRRGAHDDEDFVYICDLGIARSSSDTTFTAADRYLIGTIQYMAPERLLGQEASAVSDIYSVGCVLWELMTGSPPYAGSDVSVIFGHSDRPVPRFEGDDRRTRELNNILAQALAKNPAHRYQSAKALRHDIRELLSASDPVPALRRPFSRPPPGWLRIFRRPPGGTPAWSLAAAALVVVTALLIWQPWSGVGLSAVQQLRDNAPLGSDCRETATGTDGARTELTCTTRPGLAELRLVALPDRGAVGGYLNRRAAHGCGREPVPPRRQRGERLLRGAALPRSGGVSGLSRILPEAAQLFQITVPGRELHQRPAQGAVLIEVGIGGLVCGEDVLRVLTLLHVRFLLGDPPERLMEKVPETVPASDR